MGDEEDFFDDLIRSVADAGVDVGGARRGRDAPDGGSWYNTTVSESDYIAIKTHVVQLIQGHLQTIFSDDNTHKVNKNLKIALGRTEDIHYGVRFHFQASGGKNETKLIFENLASQIRLGLPNDVKNALVSRQFSDCIIVHFYRPVHLECFSFTVKISVLCIVALLLYTVTMWFKDLSAQYGKDTGN